MIEIGPSLTAHLIGVGGIGMSGLARLLRHHGVRVTGSDRSAGPILDELRELGATVYVGHDASQLGAPDVVVYSTAIPQDNPELALARQRGIPIWHRAEMMAYLIRDQQTIAITGTHGKTTTAGLIGTMLLDAGLDPTIIVGGVMRRLKANARPGTGQFAVVEACESDRSFLKLDPKYVVITNIDREHLDQYGTFGRIIEAFGEFVAKAPRDGLVVACADCPYAASVAGSNSAPVVTYGLLREATYRGREVSSHGTTWTCRVSHSRDGELGRVTMPLPGEQYLENALACVALGRSLGLSFELIAQSIAGYQGTERRFDVLGEAGGIMVVDDYAHHPTEIRATLNAARRSFGRRLVVVFQPHLYSRTRILLSQFATAFVEADIVIATDIYAAREAPMGDIAGEDLARAVREASGDTPVHYVQERGDIPSVVLNEARENDVVLFLGAGDIYLAARETLQRLKQREDGG